MVQSIESIKAFIFDLDGCIFNSSQLRSGSPEILGHMYQNGIPFCFVSNNSHQSRNQVYKKLVNQKLNVFCPGIRKESIFMPTAFAGSYISEKYGFCRVFVCGNRNLSKNVASAGHKIVKDRNQSCDVVLVGRDTNFNWERLETALHFLLKGAQMVTTNPDLYHPLDNNRIAAETGVISAALTTVVDCKPDCMGKPEDYLVSRALSFMKSEPHTTAIVGDNLFTDILGGHKNGLFTIYLDNHQIRQTAKNLVAPVIQNIQPHLVIEHFNDLRDAFFNKDCFSQNKEDAE